MVLPVKNGVLLHNTLKHTSSFHIVAVKLEQQGLVVVYRQVGRVVWAKPLLDVFTMLVEYHLRGSVLAQIHALGKLLERLLHFGELLGWDVVFVGGRVRCTTLL